MNWIKRLFCKHRWYQEKEEGIWHKYCVYCGKKS